MTDFLDANVAVRMREAGIVIVSKRDTCAVHSRSP
jgi:hypothetical protein